MAQYLYPNSAKLTKIAQDLLPVLTKDDPIFDMMPITTQREYYVAWEQKDRYTGLQQIRGLNGAPPRVANVGASRFLTEPGVYGEFKLLDEQRILTARPLGTFGDAIDLTDLTLEEQEHLLNRYISRYKTIGWNILQGTYSVPAPNGAIMATDSYPVQTYAVGTTWATAATSTPLNDFRQVMLKHRGHSVDFGSRAKAFMNQVTVNNLLNNTNNADIYGRRVTGLATANSVAGMNSVLLQDDLPQITPYDLGYLDDSSTFQPFIPNGTVIVVGERPAGQKIGEFRETANLVNPNMAPGMYMKTIIEDQHIPPKFEVHCGANMAPVIYYPSAVVVMSV